MSDATAYKAVIKFCRKNSVPMTIDAATDVFVQEEPSGREHAKLLETNAKLRRELNAITDSHDHVLHENRELEQALDRTQKKCIKLEAAVKAARADGAANGLLRTANATLRVDLRESQLAFAKTLMEYHRQQEEHVKKIKDLTAENLVLKKTLCDVAVGKKQ
jgi:hypothetical protein